MAFRQLLFALTIFIPLTMLWVFTWSISSNGMICPELRRHRGRMRSSCSPLIGMLIHFLTREPQPEVSGSRPYGQTPPPPPPPRPVPAAAAADATSGVDAMADQVERLADPRDRGILTEDEFPREEDALFGCPPT